MFGFSCPTFDAASWTSGAIADVPPTKVSILTDSGGSALARANLLIAAVSVDAATEKVWFAIDSPQNIGKVFYNIRTTDPTGVRRWKWSRSQELFDLGTASAQVTDVLYDPSGAFYNSADGGHYDYLMYIVNQPSCEPGVAGLLQVAFSNNGECWTNPVWVRYPSGTPTTNCGGQAISAVQVESVGAVLGAERIYLLGIEGNLSFLADPANMSSTQTYHGYSFKADPSVVYLQGPVSGSGMFNPVMSGGVAPTYETYHYFMNLAIAYSAGDGYLYASRAYPYPFTRVPDSAITPCGSQGTSWCKKSPATLPNRVQIYRMYIGSLANIGLVQTGTWQLVKDVGHQSGYWNSLQGSCPSTGTALQAPQLNSGRDFSSASFLRTSVGNLAAGISRGVLLGDSFVLNRSQAATCSITGLERLTFLYF